MIDKIIVFAYLLVILTVGILAGRKVKDIKHYSIAAKSYGPWVVFATLFASFLGGGFSMGNAEKVFIFGIANIVALWGFSLKEILVAKFVAPKIKSFPKAISVGDIMEKNYGSFGKIVSGFFSFFLCVGILGAQVSAIGYTFNLFLGVPQLVGILIGCSIVIIYSTIGGMNSVVKTDILQFLLLGIGLPVTLIMGIIHVGGIDALISSVPASHFQVPADGKSIMSLISLFLVFLLGETLVPPYVQRLLIGKDAKSVEKGTLWAGIFSIPFFAITGLIGLVALSINPDLNPNMSIPFVINECLPAVLKGLIIAGVVSIAMSSADSFLNSASVAVVHDIMKPIMKKDLKGKDELLWAKIVTAISGIVAVVLAIKVESVLGLLMYAYDFWAPIILVPLFFTLIGKRFGVKDFIWGAFSGFLFIILWKSYFSIDCDINGLPFAVMINALAMLTSSKIRKK